MAAKSMAIATAVSSTWQKAKRGMRQPSRGICISVSRHQARGARKAASRGALRQRMKHRMAQQTCWALMAASESSRRDGGMRTWRSWRGVGSIGVSKEGGMRRSGENIKPAAWRWRRAKGKRRINEQKKRQ